MEERRDKLYKSQLLNIFNKGGGLITVFLMLVFFEGYTQTNDPYQLKKIGQMTPEATKFANYYYTPAVSATGTVPIEIPLYEIDVDGLKIPISLSYQTSGIQVTQLSGSVGLGWSLNVGGGVYRSINGLPDESVGTNGATFLGQAFPASAYLANNIKANTQQMQSTLESFATNGIDINQDNYSYNFLNNAGGIFFNNKLELKQLNDNKLSFSYDSKALNSFLVKDDNGNSFNFNVREYTSTYSNPSNWSSSGATGWKLNEITTVHNKKVNFSYIDYSTSYSYPSSSTLFRIKGLNTEKAGNCFDDREGSNTIYTSVNNGNKLISMVSSQDLTIAFTYSDDAKASNWKKKLDKIEVKNKNGDIIRRIKFNYELFKGNPQLKLSRLAFEDTVGEEKQVYTFQYHEEYGLPETLSLSKDGFGYYNGYDNKHLLYIAGTSWTAYRDVSDNYTRQGSLKQINYPTSGGLKLYYSANKSGTRCAPGLRVDKIELFDSDGLVVNTKQYEYASPEGLWISFPDNAIRDFPVDQAYFGAASCYSYSSEKTMKKSHLPSNFYYKKVVIKEVVNGKESTTVENYDDPLPSITNDAMEGYIFQPILTSREFYSGNEITGVKVKSESFNYTPVIGTTDDADMYELFPSFLTNMYLLSSNGTEIMHPCLNYQPGLFVKSTLRAKWTKLTGKEEKLYSDGVKSSSVATSYQYNNNDHRYPTNILTSRSQGGTINQEIKYPQDMIKGSIDPLGVYQLMFSKNMLSTAIISKEDVEGRVKGQMSEFTKTSHGFPALSAVKSLNSATGVYEGRIRNNLYDKYGNVIEQQLEKGTPKCFLYGYAGRYPVAEIENASYDQVFKILGQTTINALDQATVSDATIVAAMNKLRADNSMSRSMITSYTYKPLVGITSKTDARGEIETYQYDGMQRLQHIIDRSSNIVKSFSYNYRGEIIYTNDLKSKVFRKNNCSGLVGSEVTYTVPAGKYTSKISKYDANSQASNDIDANGQNYANTNGTCLDCRRVKIMIPPAALPNLYIRFQDCTTLTYQVVAANQLDHDYVPDGQGRYAYYVCAQAFFIGFRYGSSGTDQTINGVTTSWQESCN